MNKVKLSIVVITLNEEANIERCLKSVQWADEILVYDSGSVDATVKIAQSLGAKVISGPWLGFGPTKNKAMLLAANDWIFSVDADEQVTAELENEIIEKLNKIGVTNDLDLAFKIPRLSFYLKHWVRRGGWYPDYQVRLFNRKVNNWTLTAVHEKVHAKSYIQLKNHLNHYVFRNIEHHIKTNNKYSSLMAQEMFLQKKKFSMFHFLTKPTVKFLECYLLKLGFLDGWVGFFIAKGAAYSVLLKWSKLKELEINEQ